MKLAINGVLHTVKHEGASPETAKLVNNVLGGDRPLSALALGGGLGSLGSARLIPFPENWKPQAVSKSSLDHAQEMTKSLLDAIPPGVELPPAIDAIGAVVAGFDIVKNRPLQGGANEQTFLVFSSNIVDIASFVADVIPALHPLGQQLSIISMVIRTKNQEVHSFSLTPGIAAPRGR